MTTREEALRLADALEAAFPQYGDGIRSGRERFALDAAALLRQWPDAAAQEPVAEIHAGHLRPHNEAGQLHGITAPGSAA